MAKQAKQRTKVGKTGKKPMTIKDTINHQRLEEKYDGNVQPWRKWGPYVSERSWATVREDYSANGDAWNYFPHDLARSKAFRWGEDGLAAICDRYQLMVFALALWNGNDPILKERLFGLNSSEGNHGEDVKEYYFYLDSTPDHAYMKMLYKYPQRAFPYGPLVDENRRRNGQGPEYELLDTGIFDDDRYFDVFVEYAKASEEDICVRVEVFNRGPEDAEIHLLPHLWFRNTWGWGAQRQPTPTIKAGKKSAGYVSVEADDRDALPLSNLPFEYKLGTRYLYGPADGVALFTDNETNNQRLYNAPNPSPYVKDAFHRHVIQGEDCVNPERRGTKSCIHYRRVVPAGGSVTLDLRMSDKPLKDPLADIPHFVEDRRREADEFYRHVHPPKATEDEKLIQRQALAGMLWTKMIYIFDVHEWLDGDNPNLPPPESRKHIRNHHWMHLNSMRILSMPDKWEYPWFAAWDLAFHCVALALVDPWFAKENLWYMLFEQFQHPNGQIPAYEWEFSDLNPPVHAWAVWQVYRMEKKRLQNADREFLEKCFQKLLMNFAWWVNKVDSQGNNVFEGGFLGLDNITVLDRSEKLPGGAILEQSDATGWMGFFCLHLMRIALELTKEDNPPGSLEERKGQKVGRKIYEGMATKFFEHYVYIGSAMKHMGNRNYQLWDEEDGFFYDVLRYPSGEFHRFRVRSLVGLIPMYAIDVLKDQPLRDKFHLNYFLRNVDWFIENRRDLVGRACYTDELGDAKGKKSKVHVLSIVDQHQLTRLLQRIWNEDEFLSDYGVRSLSKAHEKEPYRFGQSVVGYEPAEALVKIKGGNSNWRGPIWFPTSFLIIESLLKFSEALGPDFKVQTPEGDLSPKDMAREIADRMIGIFRRNEKGERPVYGPARKFQDDPHWRDCILFYEYFHGDTGVGLGASHQTGWSGLVANLIDRWRSE